MGIFLIGVVLKKASLPYASELLIISLTGLGLLYLLLPILIFRTQKAGGHLLAYFAGLVLSVALMGALFVIESWPYGNEMRISAELALIPLAILLIVLMAMNYKDIEKRKVYLRIGLRFLILFLFFKF